MNRRVTVALLLVWAAVCGLAGPAEAVRFKYENLGTLGGEQLYAFAGMEGKEAGINDAGQVCGISFTAGGAWHAFVKSPGQAMADLGNLSGGTASHAPDIDSNGTVVGWYNDISGDHACTWVHPPGGVYQFNSLGGTDSSVRGLNNTGYLVGQAVPDGGSNYHAYVLPPGVEPIDLGVLTGAIASTAKGINNSNTIVGYSWNNSLVYTACFWSPAGGGTYSAPASLFGLASSKAHAINNQGQAVGYVNTSGKNQAVLQAPGQELQYLGALVPGYESEAYDINDSGWVVGQAGYYDGSNAFLWTPGGGMQNLNCLLVNPPGVKLTWAMGINRHGEIVGYTDNSVFKLTPIRGAPLSLLLD